MYRYIYIYLSIICFLQTFLLTHRYIRHIHVTCIYITCTSCLFPQVHCKLHTPMALMRYFPETRRTLVIPEGGATFSLLDDSFQLTSLVKPLTMFSFNKKQMKVRCCTAQYACECMCRNVYVYVYVCV